jgi:Arc/MetJ family transcription regulator
MKRTTVMVDTDLLEEATRISGKKNWSATIHLALTELVRRAKAERILELRGSGLWRGDLSEMRRDQPKRRRKKGA